MRQFPNLICGDIIYHVPTGTKEYVKKHDRGNHKKWEFSTNKRNNVSKLSIFSEPFTSVYHLVKSRNSAKWQNAENIYKGMVIRPSHAFHGLSRKNIGVIVGIWNDEKTQKASILMDSGTIIHMTNTECSLLLKDIGCFRKWVNEEYTNDTDVYMKHANGYFESLFINKVFDNYRGYIS